MADPCITPAGEMFTSHWIEPLLYKVVGDSYVLVGSYDPPYNVRYLAYSEESSGIIDPSIAAPISAILSSSPNPTNSSAVIRIRTMPGQAYRLTLVDLGGRVVRRFSGVGPQGELAISWDGRDFGGRAVASGTYWCRLDGSIDSDGLRVVVIR